MSRLVIATTFAVLAGCAGAQPRTRPAADADRLSASGSQAYAAGEYRTAAARFSAAADAARSLDDRGRLARELHNRGLALLAAGAPQPAAEDFAAALGFSGDAPAEDRAATRLAHAQALAAVGKNSEALAEADLAATEATGNRTLAARAIAASATLALTLGDAPGASRRLAAAEPGSDPLAGAAVDHARGLIALAAQDALGAEGAFARAIEGCREAGDQAGLAAALEGSARTAEASGRWAEAARRWRRAAGVPVGGEPRLGRCLRAAAAAESKL